MRKSALDSALKPLYYGRQSITEEDIQAVVDTLRSDLLTQGPAIAEFERKLATYCGARFAVVVANATAALHIACSAFEIKKGSRLWTSANTFAASSNCGLYLGAEVDFVDIDPGTLNISVEALTTKLESAKKQGRLPDLLIPVHHSGLSCDMTAIRELSKHYGFKILEDASHAIGGSFQGKKIGCCGLSEATVFSFHPVKIITTGEGGALLTNDEKLYQKFLRLRSHGITRDVASMTSPSHGPWYYQQIDLGWNYRMTDLQAALGTSQMKRIDEFVSKRNEIAQYYRRELKSFPLEFQSESKQAYSAYHLFVVRLKLDRIKKSQVQVFQEMAALGVIGNLHYIPVYLHPYYESLGFKKGHCPESEKYYAEALTLPMYPSLEQSDLDSVVNALRKTIGNLK